MAASNRLFGLSSQRGKALFIQLMTEISKKPSWEAYVKRGNIYYEQSNYEAAIADYKRAIRLNPKNALLYSHLASAHYALQDGDAVMECFEQAIKLDPAFSSAYYKRGNVFYSRRQYERAAADYTKAIELNPTYVPAYRNRGNVFYDLRRYEEAVADYAKAIELGQTSEFGPTSRDYYNRGDAYCCLNHYAAAVPDYRKALALNPSDEMIQCAFNDLFGEVKKLSYECQRPLLEHYLEAALDWEKKNARGKIIASETVMEQMRVVDLALNEAEGQSHVIAAAPVSGVGLTLVEQLEWPDINNDGRDDRIFRL